MPRMMQYLFRPARVVFLICFGVYLVLLCPDLAWDDSGEFIAAGYCLGVPHAPGSPLLVLLGKLFTLLPVGSSAFRVNLLSAVATAGFVSLLCVLLGRLVFPSAHRHVPVILSLAVGFSPWVLRHALAAEVYGLAWLCLVASLLLGDEYRRRGCRLPCSLYVLWGILAGMGISTSALLVPFAVLLIVVPFVDRRGVWVPPSRMAVGLIIGFAPLGLPRLRSACPLPLFYSSASSLEGLVRYLLGEQFAGQIIGDTYGFDLESFLLAAAGAIVLIVLLSLSPRRKELLWIAAVGVINLSFVLLRRHPGHFFVPWLFSVVLLAASLWPAKFGRFIAFACIAAACVWSAKSPLRTNDIPLRWLQRTTLAIPSSSALYVGEINTAFPLLYSFVVEREPLRVDIYPVWNSTRLEQIERLRESRGIVYVDMDLVDFSRRTGRGHELFFDAVPDPILLRIRPVKSPSWEGWWNLEKAWIYEHRRRMTHLDREILGKHYFNLGIFCLEKEIPLGKTLLALARGLNPDLPKVERRPIPGPEY